jgi:alpha-galactosidase/6-phospho-beta-glucosidase family protein
MSLHTQSPMAESTSIKIAYIGGGSRGWARDLFADLALAPNLKGSIDLYDTNIDSARKNAEIAKLSFARPEAKTRFAVRAVKKLADALKGADFVVLSIEPGPMEMRYADLEIPAQYGILQPVGDTSGPGGIMRALRTIHLYAGFAEAIAEHCPKAWVINYTNPMTLCTATLHTVFPDIKAFGCCHEVFHTQTRLAKLVAKWFEVPEPDRREIRLDIAGVNHFTFATEAKWREYDLFPRLQAMVEDPKTFASRAKEARSNKKNQRWFEILGDVSNDLLRRFGALGAAGDRHLCEFVPWYVTSEEALHRWGIVLTPYSWRVARYKLIDKPVEFYAERELKPSGEEGVSLIGALLGHHNVDTNMNLPNQGQVPGLPHGHVVESYAQVRRDKITPIVSKTLPTGANALVNRIVDVQQLTLQAALGMDTDLGFQAMLADPLVSIPMDDAWKMYVKMLRHTREYLPGWQIP